MPLNPLAANADMYIIKIKLIPITVFSMIPCDEMNYSEINYKIKYIICMCALLLNKPSGWDNAHNYSTVLEV